VTVGGDRTFGASLLFETCLPAVDPWPLWLFSSLMIFSITLAKNRRIRQRIYQTSRTRHESVRSESGLLFPTIWWLDDDTFANDAVHRLPVDIGPNHFEFEGVISW
jgi:hypothetical protein